MTGILILIVLGIVLGGAGVLGLLWRASRAGAERGIGRPFLRVGLWVGLAAAVLVFSLIHTQWSVLYGFAAGLVLYVLALGWDEFMDRTLTRFYASLRRETGSYFGGVLSWFVLFLFVLFMGWQFWMNLTTYQQVTMNTAFGPVYWVVVFLFPLLTMGTFAAEKAEGTEEVLMTAPVSEVSVTLAKYLGILVFYGVMLLPSVVELGILRHIGGACDCGVGSIGKPDTGPVLTGYLGLILMGAFFASIGVFASSLTKSQILAAILSWMFAVLLLFSSGLVEALGWTGTDPGSMLSYLAPPEHLMTFLQGVVAVKDVMYFVSFIVFFLFLTVRSVESRKWR